MPDAARKWLETHGHSRLCQVDGGDVLVCTCHYRHFLRLLAECERLGTESMLWERDWGRAVADRRALVALLQVLQRSGTEISWIYAKEYKDAWQALGAELQGEIDELPL